MLLWILVLVLIGVLVQVVPMDSRIRTVVQILCAVIAVVVILQLLAPGLLADWPVRR